MTVPTEELPPHLIQLAEEVDREVVRDEKGTLRFKPDPLYSVMTDCTDLNELWMRANGTEGIEIEDMKKLYQKMGYSLEGYWEIFSGKTAFGMEIE